MRIAKDGCSCDRARLDDEALARDGARPRGFEQLPGGKHDTAPGGGLAAQAAVQVDRLRARGNAS